MRVLSLFDGISCGMVALERAGVPVERYVAYEIDQPAIGISKQNYPNIEHCGDVRDADFSKYSGFDMILAGFPCQDLSINKRNRAGLQGERSGLFWELVRAIKEVKPKYFLVENNWKMPEADKNTISRELGVEPILFDSALVSAQSRKRLYWTNIPFIGFPADKLIFVKDILEPGAVGEDLAGITTFNGRKEVPHNGPLRVGTIGKGGQGERVYSIQGKTTTLTANGGGRGAKAGLYLVDGKVRKPTAVECERAQTLPDNYTAGLTETGRKKVIGNGWTVDVIAHLLRGLEGGRV